MAKVALVGFLATICASWISACSISPSATSIIGLIFGVICKALGLLDEAPMTKAGADASCLSSSPSASSATSPSPPRRACSRCSGRSLSSSSPGSVTFIVLGSLVGKLVGMSWQMACAIGSTCLFGFPGTYIVTNEVVAATAKNEEEKQLMLDHMMPKMLIAGMVTVSITSVLIASFMTSLLAA